MIKIYSMPTCSWCQKTKKYLDSLNIDYTDIDVSTDIQGREEMINISHQQSVPVIDIDGNVIIGFQKEKIDELLNK